MRNRLVIIQLLLLSHVWTCITVQNDSSAFGKCEGKLDPDPGILKPCLEKYQVYLNKKTSFEPSRGLFSSMDIYCCAQKFLDKCIKQTCGEEFDPCDSNTKASLIRNQLILYVNLTDKKKFTKRPKNNESCPCDMRKKYCPRPDAIHPFISGTWNGSLLAILFVTCLIGLIGLCIGHVIFWCLQKWKLWCACCCKNNNGDGPAENGSEQRTNSLESGL